MNLKQVSSMFILVAAIASPAWPRAGGNTSVGRAPAAQAPAAQAPAAQAQAPAARAPAARPAPAPAPASPPPAAYVPQTSYVAQPSGPSALGTAGAAAAGAIAGSMLGNALTRPNQQVVGAGAPAAPGTVIESGSGGSFVQTPAAAPTGSTIVVRDTSFPWGWFWFLILAGLAAWAFLIFKRRNPNASVRDSLESALLKPNEKHKEVVFDPLMTFFRIQQASMDDDQLALNNMCTGGIALALAGNPEPNRSATATLKGVTYLDLGGNEIEFKFTDTVDGKKVIEVWVFNEENKLDGITVISSTSTDS